jgi:hypothetical protein
MNQQQAIAYFVGLGWTEAQAAGIVANLIAESNLNPTAVGDGGQAYGIAQWHPDRQAKFSASFGKDIHGSSIDEQLAFVNHELNNSEKAAGDALRACTTASEAGACVSELYERPADKQGEATRRGALAAQLAGEVAQPAVEPPPAQPGENMGAIALSLLGPLLQPIIEKFTGRAQTAISKATGADPASAGQFLQGLITQIGTAVGVPVTDPASAIQAVAEVTKQPAAQQAATVAGLESYSLEQLAPILDKIHGYSKDEWAATEASVQAARDANAAFTTPEQLMANPAFLFGIAILVLVCFVVFSVMWKDALVAAIAGANGADIVEVLKAVPGFSTDMQAFVIGAIVGSALTAVIQYFYGSTKQSAAKDAAIQNLSTK